MARRGTVTGAESADATALTRAIGAKDKSIAAQARGSGAQANNTFAGNRLRKLGNSGRSARTPALSQSQKVVARGNAKASNPTRIGGPGTSSTNRAPRTTTRTQSRGPGMTGAVRVRGGR